jgi:hypothetical protein
MMLLFEPTDLIQLRSSTVMLLKPAATECPEELQQLETGKNIRDLVHGGILNIAVISCDAAEEQLQEKQLSAAGVINCDAAVGQLLVKTLDEMLELEAGEDVGDLIHGGALLLHLHPGGEQAAAHRLVPLFLAAQLHLIGVKRQCHNPSPVLQGELNQPF